MPNKSGKRLIPIQERMRRDILFRYVTGPNAGESAGGTTWASCSSKNEGEKVKPPKFMVGHGIFGLVTFEAPKQTEFTPSCIDDLLALKNKKTR